MALYRISPFSPVFFVSEQHFYGFLNLRSEKLAGMSTRNQYNYYNPFQSVDTNQSIKIKQRAYLRLKVSWQLLSEYGSFSSHSLPAIYKNHNKECP